MKLLSTIAYNCLSLLARVLPVGIAYLIGETLALISFPLLRSRRQNLEQNLRVVLSRQGDPPSSCQIRRMALATTLNFGRAVVDTFMVPYIRDKNLKIDVKGKQHLDAALAAGNGVILVTAHLGTWELGGAILADMGYGFTTVAGTQFTSWLSPQIKKIKQAKRIVVLPHTSVMRIYRVLKNGGLVILHIDGDQFFGGTQVRFFGRPALIPRGPAALALKTGARLLCGFAIRHSRCEIEVRITNEIPTDNLNEVEITQSIIDIVETYISKYNNQWCMFRSIWKAQS